MFYSQEVLTSRKYGVATVWLVATLGSKSSVKKVSRKAILDTNVPKACDTIVTPPAPMALRFQSNLLYGIVGVYSQQCGYMLSDAEVAHKEMRALMKVIHGNELNAEGANKGRAEQLMLPDDPNYLPDFDLMPLDLDLDLDLDLNSILSPYNSQLLDVDSSSQHDIGGLIIPRSSSQFIGSATATGGFLGRGGSGAGSRVEIGGLDDDLGLTIDDDGNLQMPEDPFRQVGAPSVRGERAEVGIAGSALGGEGEEARAGDDLLGMPDDDGFFPLQDDSVSSTQNDANLPIVDGQEQQQETSEETATAPIRRRAANKIKIIPLDTSMELRNAELARWDREYVTNMLDAIRQKNAGRASALAKKNAEYWILGERDDNGLLSMFSGAQLLEALTGINLRADGKKRPRDEGYETDEGRRVRPRSDPPSDEVGRGVDDEGYMPVIGDDTIEQGREAPTPLDDRHLSNIMPWHQSTGSRRPTGVFSAGAPTSASYGGPMPQLGSLLRHSSRLPSASPLMGRGAVAGGTQDLQLAGSDDDMAMTGLDDFELFGPAAEVDTQTAETSQWQRAALEGESMHFLEFVQTSIAEIDQAREQAGLVDDETEKSRGSIMFEELILPESHNRIVAAQALLHVLALGTRNLLEVQQEESYGSITLREFTAV